jgi:ribosome biogenesis GTPase / thiamine phosphate phosphatase
MQKFTLSDLGYNDFFEAGRKNMNLTGYTIARVVAEYKGKYKAIGTDGEYSAQVTGKQIFRAINREDFPAVGDWIAIDKLSGNKAVIRGILPRKTILKKKYSNKLDNQIIATNIDTAFIVESMDRNYNLNRIERFLVITEEGKIKPAIILNKIDLISNSELDTKVTQIKSRVNNIAIFPISTITNLGMNELTDSIVRGNTYCFLGSSGVGKSSLINKLLGKDKIKTGEISKTTGKGKHTTSVREMYYLDNGGIVIDNPGTREVGIADTEEGLENVFDEIGLLSKRCKYTNCTHLQEPGCAVLDALKKEKLDSGKYRNYVKLKKESDYYKMTDVEKRVKDRKFGQFVKKYFDNLTKK